MRFYKKSKPTPLNLPSCFLTIFSTKRIAHSRIHQPTAIIELIMMKSILLNLPCYLLRTLPTKAWPPLTNLLAHRHRHPLRLPYQSAATFLGLSLTKFCKQAGHFQESSSIYLTPEPISAGPHLTNPSARSSPTFPQSSSPFRTN